MRKIIPVLLLFFLTASATGAVSYEITVENDTAYVNASFEVYAENEFKSIRTNWRVGDDATINSVRDSIGTIEQVEAYDQNEPGIYTKQGDQLKITTNHGDLRRSSAVEVQYHVPANVTTWYEDLHIFEMQLSGYRDQFEEFDEEKTYVQVTVEDTILGLSQNFGFQSSYTNHTGTFSGDGPANIKVVYSDRQGDYENFILFGEANLTAADDSYPLARLVTGQSVEFRKLPVIILDEETYNSRLDAWSAGRYKGGGLIYIQQDQVEQDGFTGLVMHEVMHAFNEKPLAWVEANYGMFDEGMANYVEYLVKENMDVRHAEIFGDAVEWKAPCSNSSNTCRYRLDPRGTPDDLWQYYQKDSDFMKGWSPSQEGIIRQGLSRKTFGYAYSELLIRNLVRQKDPLHLHSVYEDLLDIDTSVETPEAYASTLSSVLETDVRPCEELSQDAMERCLESVRQYIPDIPESVEVNGEREQIRFHKVEIPTSQTENDTKTVPASNRDIKTGFIDQFISFLLQSATTLINDIAQLLQ